ISIQWPYGSNLHCEILVDDQIVAQADQFIAPRLLHPKDDPLYGVIQCGAPVDTPIAPPAQVPSPATCRLRPPPGGPGPFPGTLIRFGEPRLLGLGVIRRLK